MMKKKEFERCKAAQIRAVKAMDELQEQRAAALSKVLWELYEAGCHRQTAPDGKPCAICRSAEHQAFECPFNAFVRFDALRRTVRKLAQVDSEKSKDVKMPDAEDGWIGE